MSYQQFGHIDPNERLGHYAEEAPPPESDDDAPRRRWPGVLLAIGVMGMFAGGLWFAYHQGTKHAAVSAVGSSDAVPLIRVNPDPVKVKPDKVGGMSMPERDGPVYATRGKMAEHILPPPEAPAPRPTAPPPPPPLPVVAQAPDPPPTLQPMPAPLPAPSPSQAGTAPKPAKAPAEAKVTDAAVKPAAAGGGVRIQLASVRSPEAAREEWTRLKRDNDDLLGKLNGVAVKADLGERGIWYRVEAGPVGDKAAAAKLCKALKERDLGCQLVQ